MEYMMLIVLIVLMGVMMFYSSRKAKKQQQERQAFRTSLAPGTEVITIGGLCSSGLCERRRRRRER